ncbi:hypothetical protein B0O80DRAFT_447579 [Mortierella sp. GBAus27b]|nr:hypothetical protein B0O80DRAFT_447579 [Mortierella sp. GBAus27b]
MSSITSDLVLKTRHGSIYQAIGAFSDASEADGADKFLLELRTAIQKAHKAAGTDTRLEEWKAEIESIRFQSAVRRHYTRKARESGGSGTRKRPARTPSSSSTAQTSSSSPELTVEDLCVDGMYLEKGEETIGQRIKEAALDLEHGKATTFATAHERRIFVLGGSSILDLVDRSPMSQLFQVFSDPTERQELVTMFKDLSVKNSSPSEEPEELLVHWRICTEIAKCKGLPSARAYLFREMADCSSDKVDELWLLLTMVDILINNQSVLTNTVNTTEGDLLTTIWQPLLARLFYGRQKETSIRVKIGESTSAPANTEKRTFYDDDTTVAFKIDARVLLDDDQGNEIDLAAVEVAKAYQKQKIFSDGTKVIRKAKTIVDQLAKIFGDDVNFTRNTIGFGMQVSCLTAIIFSVHLVAPRLYVAWPEYTIALPSSEGTLELFGDAIRALLWFKDMIQETASHVKGALASQTTIQGMYGYTESIEPLGQKDWIGGTYYTPPKTARVRTIKDVLKVPFPIQAIMDARPRQTTTLSSKAHPEANYDENGWAVVRTGDGQLRFFNKHTSTYLEKRGGKKPRLETPAEL